MLFYSIQSNGNNAKRNKTSRGELDYRKPMCKLTSIGEYFKNFIDAKVGQNLWEFTFSMGCREPITNHVRKFAS